jgi:hypothetical protein
MHIPCQRRKSPLFPESATSLVKCSSPEAQSLRGVVQQMHHVPGAKRKRGEFKKR